MKVKTCIYTIALNEIKHVDLFMEANKGADLVLVCDTGSTDGTPERLRELGAVVYNITQKPWRFDIPRNTALNLIPDDIDICLSIDLDEYLQPGWLDALNLAWNTHNGNIKRVGYDYIWNWYDDNVTPKTKFYADKIHHRHGYFWKHPCHETLQWNGQGHETKIVIPEIQLHHRADVTKSRSQYLNLLELAVKEDPTNDRMSHYYGRELMFRTKFEDAIQELKRHLSLPSATWNEERAASLRFIARCERFLNRLKESQQTALLSTIECPTTREPWLELARCSYINEDWPTCFWASTQCLNIKERSLSYISESDSWGWEPYDLAATSAYFLGIYSKAKEYGLEAQRLNPNDQRLIDNLKFYTEK